MSFVFKKGQVYTWPVEFEVPVSGGKTEKKTFEAKFKLLKQSEVRDLVQGEGASDVAFCEKVLVGWSGVQDEGGSEIEFSAESMAEVLEFPGVARSVVLAYLASLAGAKVKN
jgi:hypothetical protein